MRGQRRGWVQSRGPQPKPHSSWARGSMTTTEIISLRFYVWFHSCRYTMSTCELLHMAGVFPRKNWLQLLAQASTSFLSSILSQPDIWLGFKCILPFLTQEVVTEIVPLSSWGPVPRTDLEFPLFCYYEKPFLVATQPPCQIPCGTAEAGIHTLEGVPTQDWICTEPVSTQAWSTAAACS